MTKLWAKFSWTFRAMTKSRCIFGWKWINFSPITTVRKSRSYIIYPWIAFPLILSLCTDTKWSKPLSMITLRWLALLLFNGNSSCWRVLSVASSSESEKINPKFFTKLLVLGIFQTLRDWVVKIYASDMPSAAQLFQKYDIFGR